MKRRRLSPEDRDLWQRYTKTADRLAESRAAPVPEAPTPPVPNPVAPRRIDPFKLGAQARPQTSTHALAPSISEQVAAAPLRMDAKAHKRMKAGKLRPEGKLDLHGMTLATAQPALTRFVMAAHADGKRLILVVTGKGKSKPSQTVMPNRLGVLKHQVPMWLTMAPLSSVVLQVTEANRSHGGTGAYYVYLRRAR
ncbi:DNA mismatch repair protein MutS [Jannaschia pagri]|uniref:DNA mismatch repair protein MutS n=1 Tax=Jannaschia pagri TaxID=2829797 RepID=A0ABQ4NLI1_9RHOB|nr:MULTISPECIES: Smr/MutS family protein [unclassified Jannaschia]GIT91438.1 DNA mismatch repair protein MutS [Jannaschia sp. AI_61]GIT95272.1 DNA mismatch repair protein MutS [Jannaschia sp. AI_62]